MALRLDHVNADTASLSSSLHDFGVTPTSETQSAIANRETTASSHLANRTSVASLAMTPTPPPGAIDSNVPNLPEPPPLAVPYSVFSPGQKWAIVMLATCAGLFSPLGANIYFPAIPSLSLAFHKSVQDIKCVLSFKDSP